MEAKPVSKELVLSAIAPRSPESHKGTYGKVLALCGCTQYRGAAALSVLGALRAGAGLVTLAAPECVCAAVAPRVMEATFLPDIPGRAVEAVLADPHAVLLAGCGKQPTPAVAAEMAWALDTAKGIKVLDAGGLSSLAGPACQQALAEAAASGALIVTPHPGEMARLTGASVEEIEADRPAAAMEFARDTGAVVVLKGHRTLTACPDGRIWVNTTGNAGLARGGSGDVLAGIIAGLAAQGLSAEMAAVCGVWLHGEAADRCAARLSMQCMLPGDILADLAAFFRENGR